MKFSIGQIGVILSAYGLIQFLLRIPIGILSDRINRRITFIFVGLGASILSGFGFFFSHSLVHFLLFRSLAGLAASTWVIFTIVFNNFFKGDTNRSMGNLVFIMVISQIISTFTGGFLGEKLSWNYIFLISAFLAIASLILSVFLREGNMKENNKQRYRYNELISVVKNKKLILVSVITSLLQFIIHSTVFGFTPVLAVERLGASSFQLGILILMELFPSAFGALLSGKYFSVILGKRRTIYIGFLLLSVSLLFFPMVSHLYILYALQFFAGLGRGMTLPMLMAYSLQIVAERKRATAMGFFQSIYALGMFIGPAFSGFLGDIGGLSIIYFAAAFIGLIAFFLSYKFLF